MGKISARSATATSPDLQDFFARYGAVLEAVARRVHALRARGVEHTPSRELASWVARDLPTLYARTFGKDKPLALKAWRVRTMLSAAAYLGAFEALDLRSVRGRGVAVAHPSPRRRRRPLAVVDGGRKAA